MRRGRERVKVGAPSFRSPGHRLCAVQTPTVVRAFVALGIALAIGACGASATATPPIVPGASDAPREVNLIAKDYAFLPEALDLVPGETVLLHVINGGLEIHEAIIGDMAVQDAWEVAEAGTVGAPPGPTPVVSVPPEVSGLRIVVRSGERVDVVWTVPDTTARLIVGCHIPGHWQKGMQIPVRWVAPAPTAPMAPAP
jgi:uncharacterized cupredoxin-like copper-binding protein